ncbi:hypothetical protein VTN49DRAFT_8015 [Thermomyces lanuginosus]|uniref:uncharacterized protein n=1 Tax=Thermomyces lanuginosus TaxID=5541 RepID=UPI0037426839
MAQPAYLISKIGDPLFALGIGFTSALLRIQRDRRDQLQQHRESTTGQQQQQRQRWEAQDDADASMGRIMATAGERIRKLLRGEYRGL